MQVNKKHSVLLLVVLSALLMLVIMDYAPDKKDTDVFIWNKKWDVIEFQNKRFIRKSGLMSNEYFFETKAVKGNDSRIYKKRKGSYAVKNIFSNMDKPLLKGTYDRKSFEVSEPESLKNLPDDILLYESASRTPITMHFTARLKNGNLAVLVSNDPDMIYIIPPHYVNAIQSDTGNFREKRIFVYETNSYIERIELQGLKGSKNSLKISQEQFKNKEGIKIKWQDEKGRELPPALVSGLDSAVRNLQIIQFEDDPDYQLPCENPLETYRLIITTNKGRKDELKIDTCKDSGYAYLQLNDESYRDAISMNSVQSMIQASEQIQKYPPAKKPDKK